MQEREELEQRRREAEMGKLRADMPAAPQAQQQQPGGGGGAACCSGAGADHHHHHHHQHQQQQAAAGSEQQAQQRGQQQAQRPPQRGRIVLDGRLPTLADVDEDGGSEGDRLAELD